MVRSLATVLPECVNSQIYAFAGSRYDIPTPMRTSREERMTKRCRLAVVTLMAAAGCALTAHPGVAQGPYPSRTVKIIILSAPGSTTDTLARLVADQLSQKWGKTTIVENIAGGAMNIGAASVARSAPDGYTLFVAPPAPLSFSHLIYKDLGYEPTKFVPITMLAKIPNVLVVRKELPAASLKH